MALRSLLNQLIYNKSLRTTNLYTHFGKRYCKDVAKMEINVIDFEKLNLKVMKRDIVLIDVREPSELKEDGKIPNSINIPLSQVSEAFSMTDSMFQSRYGVPKPDNKSHPFVLSCRSGKRAKDAFERLQTLGYSNALIYAGSFQDWLKNGGKIEKET